MLTVRPARERGHFDHGWLDTWHTFSFADYHDPEHMGFGALRVINEDFVQAGQGFGTHGHRDMEILTWVLEGSLEHKDSLGNGSAIRPGEMQYMSAGSGVTHSEFNHSPSETVHLLQIWIVPSERGAKPRYGQRSFVKELETGALVLLASPDGKDGSLAIRQDAKVFAARAGAEKELAYAPAPKRRAWIQVARGSLRVNDRPLSQGDGLAVEEERAISIQAAKGAELLLFDLP